MPTSEARIQANRLNAAHSTGPKTVEGKMASRRNGFKHGLTGMGIVLRDEESNEIERRAGAMQEELQTRTETGRNLVRLAAIFSIRVEQCADHETAALSRRIRKAWDDFDARASKPVSCLRRLGRTPEGVEKLIASWSDLRNDLVQHVWSPSHAERLANLKGYLAGDCNARLFHDLSEAVLGRFDPARFTLPGLAIPPDHAGWALEQIKGIIDDELEGLRELLATFDPEEVEQLRAEAGAYASFDPSPGANLFRKYEASALRAMHNALREARLVEAKQATPEQFAANQPVQGPPAPPDPLGSSLPRPQPAPQGPARPSHLDKPLPLSFLAGLETVVDEVSRLRPAKNGQNRRPTRRGR